MTPDCVVPVAKVRDYLLDPTHPDGGPKSRFFEAHGFSRANFQKLSDALMAHFQDNDVAERIETPYGTKLVVDGELGSPDGRMPTIRSIWIVTAAAPVPSFVTAVPR